MNEELYNQNNTENGEGSGYPASDNENIAENRSVNEQELYRNVYYNDDITGQNYQYTASEQVNESAGAEKKEKKAGKVFRFAGKAVAFGLIAGVAFAGVNYAADLIYPNEKETTIRTQLSTTVNASSNSNSIATTVVDASDVVSAVMPSVVSVTSRVSNEVMYGPWTLGKQEYDASGSGIIVGQSDTEILIATNNHVVDGAESVSITFSDATPEDLSDDVTVEALVKGTRANNDLAVVAVPIENIPEEVLSYIKIALLGDSDSLKVGEGTIAIGNALGYGQSVTTGCVSALNREVVMENNLTLNMIQTDAAINSGNSGGALLNMKGEVIGINSAKYKSTGVEGMGYAIPISSVMDILDDLMNRETRTLVDENQRGYLGIQGLDITAAYSENYGAPIGISVQAVIEGGAAEAAGIKKYDIITSFDGQTVTTMTELKEVLQYYKKGETVTVTVSYIENHEYIERELELTLGDLITE